MGANNGHHDYLKRLEPEHYCGQAYVHWEMTIDKRKQGWLSPTFHQELREILIHALFRYGLACPIYCCMPDHIHMLWMGILDETDQRIAVKWFRKQTGVLLARFDVRWQKQPYDNVLAETQREHGAFEHLVEYIARNPERGGLVEQDQYLRYPYLGCMIPGYPELTLTSEDYWERFWRCYTYLCDTQLFRIKPCRESGPIKSDPT